MAAASAAQLPPYSARSLELRCLAARFKTHRPLQLVDSALTTASEAAAALRAFRCDASTLNLSERRFLFRANAAITGGGDSGGNEKAARKNIADEMRVASERAGFCARLRACAPTRLRTPVVQQRQKSQ